jgi:hypothetical protein
MKGENSNCSWDTNSCRPPAKNCVSHEKADAVFSLGHTGFAIGCSCAEYKMVFVIFLHPLFLYFHSADFGTHFLQLKKI